MRKLGWSKAQLPDLALQPKSENFLAAISACRGLRSRPGETNTGPPDPKKSLHTYTRSYICR